MVVVDLCGNKVEGKYNPSSDTPTHVELYKAFPEIGGVVHTHSSKALAVAVTRKGIPPICDDQVQILGGDVRCAPYTYPGTIEMADSVCEALEDRFGALIANHGSITLGRNLKEALLGSVILEKTAQIWIDVQALGGAVEISKEDCEFFHEFFMNKYGQKK